MSKPDNIKEDVMNQTKGDILILMGQALNQPNKPIKIEDSVKFHLAKYYSESLGLERMIFNYADLTMSYRQ